MKVCSVKSLKSIPFFHVFASKEICRPSATFTVPSRPLNDTFFCVENHAYVDTINIIAVNATSNIKEFNLLLEFFCLFSFIFFFPSFSFKFLYFLKFYKHFLVFCIAQKFHFVIGGEWYKKIFINIA